MGSARPLLVRIHRYAGLSLAAFLVFAGITGSILAFNEELDAWLNPSLFAAQDAGPPLPPSELVARVEAALPNARVTYLPLEATSGSTLDLRVASRDGEPLGYDQVFVEPASGRVAGTREWGACCLDRMHLIPFLYRAHYSLQAPGSWGIFFMGGVGVLWTFDTLLGIALTLPRGGLSWRWWNAWRIERRAGALRLNLDLHRAGGLWFGLLLLVLATSGVAMNLPEQVFRPVVSWFSNLQPSFYAQAQARLDPHPAPGQLGFGEALSRAQQHGLERGLRIHALYALHVPEYSVYAIGFAPPGKDGHTGLGPSFYYLDDRSGAVVGQDLMGHGSYGDVYLQAQYPLHSGRIAGLPGRILVAVSGLAVVVLTATGVVIWSRKLAHRRARAMRSPATTQAA